MELAVQSFVGYVKHASIKTFAHMKQRQPYCEAHKAEHTREALSKIIEGHSGRGADEVNAALERDTYMTASDAKKFGIVDREITSITEMGLAPPKAGRVFGGSVPVHTRIFNAACAAFAPCMCSAWKYHFAVN